MKKNYLITILTSIFLIIFISSIQIIFFRDDTSKLLKVGFLYVGDSSTSYTGNFIKTEKSPTYYIFCGLSSFPLFSCNFTKRSRVSFNSFSTICFFSTKGSFL